MRSPLQVDVDGIWTDERAAFVKQLCCALRRPLIFVWRRWPVRRVVARRVAASSVKSIEFEWLPAYAPELQPLDPSRTDTAFRRMADYAPHDGLPRKLALNRSLEKLSKDQQLKLSYFIVA